MAIQDYLCSMKENNIPAEFADFYYFGDFDLLPKRLGDYPGHLSLDQCRNLYHIGWLFHTREDALRAREVMRRAYVCHVLTIKGSDSIIFRRPLCP